MVLRHAGFTFAAIVLLGAARSSAGEISPPGSPSSTFIAGLPVATPITSVPMTIDESGVYYLTDSFTVASDAAHGILITADDVVLDLGGFSLVGPGTGTGGGVSAEAVVRTIVRNGTIRDFGAVGIYLGDDSTAENLRIENCPVGAGLGMTSAARHVYTRECSSLGIQSLGGSEVTDCVADDCNIGIAVLFATAVTRCSARNCESSGILAAGPITIRDCTAISISGNGFSGAMGAIIEDCSALQCGSGFVVNASTIMNCTASQCSVEGISTAGGSSSCRIEGNHVQSSPMGIRVAQRGLVADNCVTGSSTAGIFITASGVTVLDNVLIGSPTAIHHSGAGTDCFYARNTYSGAITFGTSATWGPLVTGFNSLADDVGSDHPWSNILH